MEGDAVDSASQPTSNFPWPFKKDLWSPVVQEIAQPSKDKSLDKDKPK